MAQPLPKETFRFVENGIRCNLWRCKESTYTYCWAILRWSNHRTLCRCRWLSVESKSELPVMTKFAVIIFISTGAMTDKSEILNIKAFPSAPAYELPRKLSVLLFLFIRNADSTKLMFYSTYIDLRGAFTSSFSYNFPSSKSWVPGKSAPSMFMSLTQTW